MMGQIGYPREPLPKPVRMILWVFWIAAGLVLAMPVLFVLMVGVGIILFILQPTVSNPTHRPITEPPLVEMAATGVYQTQMSHSLEVVAVTDSGPIRILDARSGAVMNTLEAAPDQRVELVGWSDGGLWATTHGVTSGRCSTGLVARAPGWSFTQVSCEEVPEVPEQLHVALPPGADTSQFCTGAITRVAAFRTGYALQVCDRTAKAFKDAPSEISDIRVLDREGRFVRQFGSEKGREDLTLVGTNLDGDLIVSKRSGLFRIPAASLVRD